MVVRIFIYFLLMVWTGIIPAHAVDINEELAYRVRFSSPSDVELLIKKGADANAVNNVGLPMVSVAAMRTDEDGVEVLKTLIKNGADVNKGGVNNQYPIVIAARENNLEMMKFLVFDAKADYTVRDLNGLLPLEIADYYGNEEAAGMIRELTMKQIEKQKWLRSDERRLELMEKLGKDYCENQYMYYYYTSGQGNHSKEFIDNEIERYRSDIQQQLQELNRYFGLSYEYALVLKQKIGDVLKKEFSDMISNRERARRGVGTEKDLAERCGRIAGVWYDEYLSTNQIEQ